MKIPNKRFTSAMASKMANARWSKPRAEDADDQYHRMLDDRRGFVVRAGCDYRGSGEVLPWSVRYAVRGRVDQFEGVVAGKVLKVAAVLRKRIR